MRKRGKKRGHMHLSAVLVPVAMAEKHMCKTANDRQTFRKLTSGDNHIKIKMIK